MFSLFLLKKKTVDRKKKNTIQNSPKESTNCLQESGLHLAVLMGIKPG